MFPVLNVPLALAALLTLWIDHLVLLQPEMAGDAVSRGFLGMVALLAALLRWLCVTVVIVRCAARGRLDFVPIRGVPFWGLHCLAGGLSGVCLMVAASSSGAVVGRDFADMDVLVLAAARLGCTVPPVLVIALLLLLVNARQHRIGAAPLRPVAFAALLIGLGGGTATMPRGPQKCCA